MRVFLFISMLAAGMGLQAQSIWDSTNLICWFTFNVPGTTNGSGLLVHTNSRPAPYTLEGNALQSENQLQLNRNQRVVMSPNLITNNQKEFTIDFVYSPSGEIGSDGSVFKMAFTNSAGKLYRLWQMDARGYNQETYYDATCLLFYRDGPFTGMNQLLFAYTFSKAFQPPTHVTLVYKRSNWTLFMNGKFTGQWLEGALGVSTYADTPSIIFGGTTNSVGSIDDVVIFNRALTTNEVAELLSPPPPSIGKVFPWPSNGNAIVQIPEGNVTSFNVLLRSTNLVTWTRLLDWRYAGTNQNKFFYKTPAEYNNRGILLEDQGATIGFGSIPTGKPVAPATFYFFKIEPWPYENYAPLNSPDILE